MLTKFNEGHPIHNIVSWRVLLTMSHVVNRCLVTRSLLAGLKIAAWATVISSILYWLHNIACNPIPWTKTIAGLVDPSLNTAK